MPYDDESLLPISALQHWLFCRRQCGLIHLEQIWRENRLTVEGQHFHKKVHDARAERKGSSWIVRGLLLRSAELGLIGKADVVEFEPVGEKDADRLTRGLLFQSISDEPDAWRVTPVEYKRGRPKQGDADRVQLCAQALCLEEMLGAAIPAGVLYYGRTRRRKDVPLDEELRTKTIAAARELRAMIESGATPPAEAGEECKSCSLVDECLPKATGGRSAAAFLQRELDRHLANGPGLPPARE